ARPGCDPRRSGAPTGAPPRCSLTYARRLHGGALPRLSARAALRALGDGADHRCLVPRGAGVRHAAGDLPDQPDPAAAGGGERVRGDLPDRAAGGHGCAYRVLMAGEHYYPGLTVRWE